MPEDELIDFSEDQDELAIAAMMKATIQKQDRNNYNSEIGVKQVAFNTLCLLIALYPPHGLTQSFQVKCQNPKRVFGSGMGG